MKRKNALLAAAAALAIIPVVTLAAKSAAKHANSTTVRAVDHVDLQRYMGKWYEQANFPMYFQRKCTANTEANYSLNPDGTVHVLNRCGTQDQGMIKAQATAKLVPGSTSKLKVRFAPDIVAALPFVWADYWIIGLDTDYRWAVVGTPDHKYLWLLSRDKQVADHDYDAMVAIASAQGFDLSKLRRTTQN